MLFHLNDEYRVRTEPYNVILERRHVSEKTSRHEGGKETWEQSYFGSFQALLNQLVEDEFGSIEKVTQINQKQAQLRDLIASIPSKVMAAVDESKHAKRSKDGT